MEHIVGVIIDAPCGHTYDVQCLVELYRAATKDETLFPPACCSRPFRLEEMRQHMDTELVRLVERKTIEFGTANRVYCFSKSCSAFIGAATDAPSALTCGGCRWQTCGHCKRRAHDLAIQCTEAQDQALLTMAEDNGWKRCPVCGQIVELVYGCNHMTCRCKHQFCFVCTRTWRTCSCPLWDERNLAVAANDMELLEQAIARVDEYNIEMDWPQRTPTPHAHFEEQPIARIHVYETADDWPQKPAPRLRPAGPDELELSEERTEPRRWRPPTPHPEGADLPANASQAEPVQEPRPLPILAPIPKRPPTGFSIVLLAGPSDAEPSAMLHGDRATAWRQTLSSHHQCAHNQWTRLHPGYTEGVSRLCNNCATLRVDFWVRTIYPC